MSNPFPCLHYLAVLGHRDRQTALAVQVHSDELASRCTPLLGCSCFSTSRMRHGCCGVGTWIILRSFEELG